MAYNNPAITVTLDKSIWNYTNNLVSEIDLQVIWMFIYATTYVFNTLNISLDLINRYIWPVPNIDYYRDTKYITKIKANQNKLLF